MNILMVLSNPFIIDNRVRKEAKSLVDEGHEVTVIVWDRRNKYFHDEEVDGVHIVHVHNSYFMRLLPHDLLRNPFWWWAAYKKGISLFENGSDFDVVHCHDLDTLCSGVLLKKRFNIKLVYDAHEIFGYMIVDDMPSVVVKFVFMMEKKLVQTVDKLITVNDPCKEYFVSVAHCPVSLIMNYDNPIIDKYVDPKNKEFTVCYIGSLSKSRMFPDLVDIIGNIKEVKFIVAGMKSGLYKEVEERCKLYQNCEFLGTIPANEVMQRTIECNAVICMFNPDFKGHQIGLPNKIFGAMATGRPIIVTKGLYYSNIVTKEKTGLTVKNNAEGVRNAILKLKNNPELCESLGKKGLQVALTTYNWDKEQKELIEVYENL